MAEEARRILKDAVTAPDRPYGLRIMPDGSRRSGFRERVESFVALVFDQRVILYDEAAARIYGELMGNCMELGRPILVADGQMAAIAWATISWWRPGMVSTSGNAAWKSSIRSRSWIEMENGTNVGCQKAALSTCSRGGEAYRLT